MSLLGRWIGKLRARRSAFASAEYWRQRYAAGGNSGAGSYAQFAEFKARVLNEFVARHDVRDVVEFGCGDGNQLLLAEYPRYVGYDISPDAIARCETLFAGDPSKSFRLLGDYRGEQCDLSMSLDVVYHLVEDAVFFDYMTRLFAAARRFVVVYSSDTEEPLSGPALHVRHRRFSDWIRANAPGWTLCQQVPNAFPYDGNPLTTSFADFHFFSRRDGRA